MYRETAYNDLSQNQLTGLFASENWSKLSPDQKIDACQEVENRFAAEHGVRPCTVVSQDINGATYGWQSGDTITLNSHMLENGTFQTTFIDANGNSQTRSVAVDAPGWNTLDTVFHEGTHGIQEQQGRMPDTYIDYKTDSDLYRIQSCEKEAFQAGQENTLNAIANYERESGKLDPDRDEYVMSVTQDSFTSANMRAAFNYNDPNIENTLNQVIYDRDHNIDRPNQSESYKQINQLCDKMETERMQELQSQLQANAQTQQPGENGLNDQLGKGQSQELENTSDQELEAEHEEDDLDSFEDVEEEFEDGYDEELEEDQDNGEDLDDGYNEEFEDDLDHTEGNDEELDDGFEEDIEENTTGSYDDGSEEDTAESAGETLDDGFGNEGSYDISSDSGYSSGSDNSNTYEE